MKIEITDLPQGRKVKNIKVDISFEEDGTGTSKVTSTTFPLNEDKHPAMTGSVTHETKPREPILKDSPEPIIAYPDIDKRAAVEVPEEMKDLEF